MPDTLICALRSVYANKEALRIFNSRSSAAPISTNATTEVGGNLAQVHRGRETRGNEGQWGQKGKSGNRGKPLLRQQSPSCSGVLVNADLSSEKGLSEEDNAQQELSSSHGISAAGNDTSVKNKQKVKRRHRNRSRGGGKSEKWHKDSKGNEANVENPLQQQTASNDIHANNALVLNTGAINEGDKQQQGPNSPNRDVAVGKDTKPKSGSGCSVPQMQRNQDTEKDVSRQNEAKLENPLLQQKTASLNDVLASKGVKQDQQQQEPNSPTRDSSVVEDTNAESNVGFNVGENQWNQGTGVNGRNAGKSLQQQQTSTLNDAVANVSSLDLHNKDGLIQVDAQKQCLDPSKIHFRAVGKDTDASNNSGQSTQQVEDLKQSSASGRGYEQDDQQQLLPSLSTHVSAAAIKDGDVGDAQKTKETPVKGKYKAVRKNKVL